MPKIHDMTSESAGIGAALRDELPDGTVVVAMIVLNGRPNEYGVYVMRRDEYGDYDLRATCPRKDDAMMFAGTILEWMET